MAPALVTDSNSQIPASLVDRFEVEVVPVIVVVDGVEYHEGVDLDADQFYEFFAGDVAPTVTTSQPSPGAFVDAYERCIARGHDEIVSVHVTEALSGTLNAARVAATMVDAEVHLVDSETASFGIACCVWEAGLAQEANGSAPAMIEAATTTAAKLHSVTALGAASLLNASGRVDVTLDEADAQLLTTGPGGAFEMIGSATSEDEVVTRLADAMSLAGAPIRVALGMADSATLPLYAQLEQRLLDRPDVVDIVRYRIGPSVGAMTGPGTLGGFFFLA